MIRIRNFAEDNTAPADSLQEPHVNGDSCHDQQNALSDEDSDSDSDLEMFLPPEPTVDRSQLRGDPEAAMKTEAAQSNLQDQLADVLVPGAFPEDTKSSSLADDIAATEEEERLIEMQNKRLASQLDPVSQFEKPLKGDKRTYACHLCSMELSSEQTKNAHQTGAKHIQKVNKHNRDHPEDVDRTWIVPIANPPSTKKKIPIRVHAKIKETQDPVVGLEYVKELLPETDPEMEPIYECELCGMKGATTNANGIFSHLMGVTHRSNFMKKKKNISNDKEFSSAECLQFAGRHAENEEPLERIIRTIKDDESYPWPPGKAPWAKEKGGTGVPPSRAQAALSKVKKEEKPSIIDVKRGIIPTEGETPKFLHEEEAFRCLQLANKILQSLGKSTNTNCILEDAVIQKIQKETNDRNGGPSDQVGSLMRMSGTPEPGPSRGHSSNHRTSRSPSSSPHRDSWFSSTNPVKYDNKDSSASRYDRQGSSCHDRQEASRYDRQGSSRYDRQGSSRYDHQGKRSYERHASSGNDRYRSNSSERRDHGRSSSEMQQGSRRDRDYERQHRHGYPDEDHRERSSSSIRRNDRHSRERMLETSSSSPLYSSPRYDSAHASPSTQFRRYDRSRDRENRSQDRNQTESPYSRYDRSSHSRDRDDKRRDDYSRYSRTRSRSRSPASRY